VRNVSYALRAWRSSAAVAAVLVSAGMFALARFGTRDATRTEPEGSANDAAPDGPAKRQAREHPPDHRPVLLANTVQQPDGGQLAVLGDYDPKAWDESCLVRRGCAPIRSIEPCESVVPTPTWAALQPLASTMIGKVVHVSGPLVAEGVTMTQMHCRAAKTDARRPCCNQAHAAVLLAGAWEPLWLAGLSCDGDDSTICCDAPAFGRTLVAQGVLRPATRDDDDFAVGRWVLSNATLCRPVDDHASDRP
jgi:hypothetical protein